MGRLPRLLLKNKTLKKVKRKYGNYRQNNVSAPRAAILLLIQSLWWIFFKVEAPTWQQLLIKQHKYFPHPIFRKYYVSNIFRYFLQGLWLLIIKPKSSETPITKKYYVALVSKLLTIRQKAGQTRAAVSQKLQQLSTSLLYHYFPKIHNPHILLGFLILSLSILVMSIARYFSVKEQIIFIFILWFLAYVIRNTPGQLAQLTLTLMSTIASCRYLWWRYSQTLVWYDWQSELFGTLLIGAETYVTFVLILGYFQSLWPLNRQPISLPSTVKKWPSVDIMFTTYDESLDIVKLGIYGALAMDWPKDKLNIYILDDGCRENFKQFSQEVGINYIERRSSEHAKAGNINHALKKTNGEFIVFFDCDYIPTRAFLQFTIGCFLENEKLAFLQTPHHFFSEDPFEKNLEPAYKVPNESHLFYDVVQNGNDTWNATYFCGSSGVFRRDAMESIGGMATYSVTEDALTSIKLHEKGYQSAYLRIPLAAGLATDSISVHIGQRIRWARGMVQILRIEKPIFNRKLTIPQRLCYFNAILHFLSGLPRLIFLTIPFAFLVLNANIFYATPLMVFLYIAPHIIHATLANGRIQAQHRHFLWNELYETIMSYYITWPAIFALINPKHGSFNVTAKGGIIKEKFADWKIATPYIAILGINMVGLLVGIAKLTFWGSASPLTVLLNLFWIVYNLIILGGVLGVIVEERQIRSFPRVSCDISGMIKQKNGYLSPCHINNFSSSGLSISVANSLTLEKKQVVSLILRRDEEEFAFECTVRRQKLQKVALELSPLNHRQYIEFIQCTFSRADIWAKYRNNFKKQSTFKSFREIILLSRIGYYKAVNFAPPLSRFLLKKLLKFNTFMLSFIPKRPLP